MNTWLSEQDRAALRKFYRHLLSLRSEAAQDTAKVKAAESGLFRLFRHPWGAAPSPPPAARTNVPPAISMEQVAPALETVLQELR